MAQNWRGRPLTGYRVVVNLIAATRTRTVLTIRPVLTRVPIPSGSRSRTRRCRP
ncbi:MAG: hypothetical protein F4X92_01885 [Gammaproteobacteria bacterium]|nr:hypothetical protein [Gammaproteobacteria bacterium]